MELAINPSKIISSLCYSVLRLEPYTNCSYGCVYCYARWYRGGPIRPRPKALAMFARVAKRLDIRIPFRLATLSEPLQDLEERAKISLKILRVAREEGIPVILCTKSDRIGKDPWKSVILEMAKEGLIVVQISVSSLKRRELEPRAPNPLDRIKSVEGIDAPKVLRLQPLIPNYSFESADEFVESVKDYVDQITVEPLRVERGELDRYRVFWDRWTDYSFEGELVKVDALELIEDISRSCRRYGIDFGLCKEGYFDLETSNCCGLDKIEAELRPTLREVYGVVKGRGRVRVDEIGEHLKDYLFGERLQELPNPIRKALRYHEKVLMKVLGKGDVLRRLTPLLDVKDSFITLIK